MQEWTVQRKRNVGVRIVNIVLNRGLSRCVYTVNDKKTCAAERSCRAETVNRSFALHLLEPNMYNEYITFSERQLSRPQSLPTLLFVVPRRMWFTESQYKTIQRCVQEQKTKKN